MAKSTIKKAVCDRCGHVKEARYAGWKHCSGTYVLTEVERKVLAGDFEFVRNYGNRVYLRHVESGWEIRVFAVDLLKALVGRGIGTLTFTESKRGTEECWRPVECGGDAE
jgi:hypothetical protein